MYKMKNGCPPPIVETNRDVRKLECQYKVRSTPKKRLTARANSPVWEKVTKGRAGMRWDNVVHKVWKGIGGSQEDILSMEQFGGCKTEVEERIERRERLALKMEDGRGRTFRDIREIKIRHWNEKVLAKTLAISCKGPGPAGKKKEAFP